jgi:hypothetical protein
MAFEVKVAAKAAIEIGEAIEWYFRISPTLALDLFEKYAFARKAIELNPLQFQELQGGYRKVVLDRFPYKVIFKVVKPEQALILAFAHHKQRNYWRKR